MHFLLIDLTEFRDRNCKLIGVIVLMLPNTLISNHLPQSSYAYIYLRTT